MPEYAKPYEDRLRELFYAAAFDPFYQFEQYSAYREPFKLPEDTWEGNHFVSVHGGEAVGFTGYRIRRPENAADGMRIIHFAGAGGRDSHGNAYIFGKDVPTVLRDIFERFRFDKVNFSVVAGNPVEKTYDKPARRYGGGIVGTKKRHVRLLDGRLYNLKEYGILADDYRRRDNI
jgi:hypothetical protein